MNHVNSFAIFLQNGIGLTQARQRNLVTTHGYNTCRGLVDSTDEGIKEVFSVINSENMHLAAADRVYIRKQVKRRFYGGRDELIMRRMCNDTITNAYVTGLTTVKVDEFVEKHNNWRKFVKAANAMSLPDVTIPKLTKNNWKNFSQATKELLQRQRGTHNIPLIYIIRENDVGNYDGVYESTKDQLTQCISLTGGNYISDNGSVWSLLAGNTVGTEAESIVSRFKDDRDGRSA